MLSTDKQTNQRYQKHNLLCQGGNNDDDKEDNDDDNAKVLTSHKKQ